MLWEGVALALAGRAGIQVPAWRLEDVAGRRILILRRFDRDGSRRVPLLSAMSMLGAHDNERRSYLELADALRIHGAATPDNATQRQGPVDRLVELLSLPPQPLDPLVSEAAAPPCPHAGRFLPDASRSRYYHEIQQKIAH